MKNTFFQKNKKLLGIVAAIVAFAAITLAYFSPILEGKRIKQHDIEMYYGMSQELRSYYIETGETSLWTNSMFGGMPAWNIAVYNDSNKMVSVEKLLSIGFPMPFNAVFISMLGFFILLLVLDCSVWISFIGGLAYGLTSYLFIVIGAGHNTKAVAMAYMAPVIAGMLLTYKGKYLWGSILTAIALALEVKANHLQITYYLLLIVVVLAIAQFFSDIKDKQIKRFFKATGCLLFAAAFGILTNTTTLYANYKYSQDTTRGKPVLVQDATNQTKGLDRDYITQWSYGKGETWSLLIPNVKGGGSALIGKQNPALEKADRQFRDSIAQSNAYWGDQPFTSGPVYIGAIIVFLFVLGALTVKGKFKWALLAATLLSILLSWGKNFQWFSDFFIDHIPGYNKFRAVSMTLVIAEVTMPLLGLLGLAEIAKGPESFKQNQKKLFIALGVTAGFCLLFYIAPKLFFSFLSQGEAEQFANMSKGKDGAIYANFANQLENVRVVIFRKDALRSLIFILLSAIPLWFLGKGKLKPQIAFPILAVLVLVDLFQIDKRYLNNDDFIPKKQQERPFTETIADKYILNDHSLDYRVLNLTRDAFNDASTSYFHKSVGGYHGAKLRRYQDAIDQYLGAEVKRFNTIFKNANSEESLIQGLQQQKVLNMLNTKYIIYNPDAEPLENPCAFGNAWIVNNVQWVDTPNEEFDAIATTDLRHNAILHKEFQQQVGEYRLTDSILGQVTLTDYKPNKLTYSFNAPKDQLVVFSEIWSDTGWKLYIDGQEQPLLRANYLLRAALIPSGEHQIVMEYAPKIWKIGNRIQLGSSLLLILGLVAAIVFSIFDSKKNAE
ncbi:MAG: YfhO family protein [Bacteroidales bacterium]|nr:YfhO family protein [Bacteroidales bacterium]